MVPTRWAPSADRYSNGVKWARRYKWPKYMRFIGDILPPINGVITLLNLLITGDGAHFVGMHYMG